MPTPGPIEPTDAADVADPRGRDRDGAADAPSEEPRATTSGAESGAGTHPDAVPEGWYPA